MTLEVPIWDIYPCSDGRPMADNTIHARAIDGVADPLRYYLEGRGVFVAKDVLWYFTEGVVTDRINPDVLVAFGVEPGDVSSYLQWWTDVVPQASSRCYRRATVPRR